MICMLLGVATLSFGSIPFAGPQGQGLQTQMSYGEQYDVNWMGLSYPVTSWSSSPGFSWTYNWSLTVDTDYVAGIHTVGYDTSNLDIQVWLY